MIYIGNHVSVSDGYLAMGVGESALGGNTFAFFTRNPRGGTAKAVPQEDIDALKDYLARENFGPLVVHAPYTMNLCSAKEDVREFSLRFFAEDLARVEQLPGQFLNFHPGSHLGQGYDVASKQIAHAINEVLKEGQTTTLLLEVMAGKGTEVGRNFQEIAGIIEQVDMKDRVGVCFDTCHVWEGGYDIVNDLDGVLKEFDEHIGIDKLMAVHLNDSKNPIGAHKDRHEKIGLGCIGKEALLNVVHHPLLQGRPFILETPNDDAGYAAEIKLIKESF